MSTTGIESRRDLFDVFQHTIEGTYDELVEDQELQPGQTMLKTFLIESNVTPEQFQDRVKITEAREVVFDLQELVIERNGADYTFFLDYEDPRFWELYTLEESEDAKKVVADMVSGVRNGLDYTWIPVEQQRDIINMSEFRDLGVSYDADDVFSEDYSEDRLDFGDSPSAAAAAAPAPSSISSTATRNAPASSAFPASASSGKSAARSYLSASPRAVSPRPAATRSSFTSTQSTRLRNGTRPSCDELRRTTASPSTVLSRDQAGGPGRMQSERVGRVLLTVVNRWAGRARI